MISFFSDSQTDKYKILVQIMGAILMCEGPNARKLSSNQRPLNCPIRTKFIGFFLNIFEYWAPIG